MVKIGTAHIELKPVLNEDALAELVKHIEDTIAAGVERGMRKAGGYSDIHWAMSVPDPVRPVLSKEETDALKRGLR